MKARIPGHISVITPVFNRVDCLTDLHESLVRQTHEEWEWILIDDGSTDGTREALARLLSDPRIRLVSNAVILRDGAGAQRARNLGFTLSRGEFVLFIDSDDLLHPTCLERRCQLLKDCPETDFTVGRCIQFEDPRSPEAGVPWAGDIPDTAEKALCAFLKEEIPWQTSGPLWRAEALQDLHWRESLPIGHDLVFHVDALVRMPTFTLNQETDYYWRKPRADSMSTFENMKARDADGSHLKALACCAGALGAAGLMAGFRTCLMHAFRRRFPQCLNFSTSSLPARAHLGPLRHAGFLSHTEARELAFAARLWHCGLRKLIWPYLNMRLRSPGAEHEHSC